jgi:predicted nucleic acid-binding Zn ribbon protein
VEEVVEEVKVVESAPAPAARTRAARPVVTEPVVQYPPFFDTLDDSIKAKVVSVTCDGDKWDITWNCPVEELAACPTCGVASPLEGVYKCPVCGEEF